MQANWPLIIPPVLALIDDSSTKYKVKGCNLLAMFLQKCPSLLLERTGLGEIFENAAMPCLLSLPSLTEEAESLEMLKAAYPALISLALVRFPGGKHQATKVKALDKILRNGVLKGYAQAGEYVSIGTLLVNEMTVLVKELGIESVKHLKVSCKLLWTERWLTLLEAYSSFADQRLRCTICCSLPGSASSFCGGGANHPHSRLASHCTSQGRDPERSDNLLVPDQGRGGAISGARRSARKH